MKNRFIAIEGIIGSGKTSLSKLIAEEYNAQLILETFKDNPFLPLFYKEQERYRFPLEMSFLAERYHQLQLQLPVPNLFQATTIADYIFSKCLIFAKTNLKDQEFRLYQQFFDIITKNLPKPDLIVYLHLSPENALKNIHKRARSYEQDISTDYLQKIQEGYIAFFKQLDLPILMLDTNNIDFVNKKEDLNVILALLNQEYGKGIHRIIL